LALWRSVSCSGPLAGIIEMKLITILTLIYFTSSVFGQIENQRSIIQKNKVKSSSQTFCITFSEGSCEGYDKKYDRKGNLIFWDMQRLGSYTRFIYDEKDRKIMTIWVNKLDSTKVDTSFIEYDNNNEIKKEIFDSDTTLYQNTYDNNGNLIKTISISKNPDGKYIEKTTVKTWTSFNKIASIVTDNKYHIRPFPLVKGHQGLIKGIFKYDKMQNLEKAVYSQGDYVFRTINYQYDDQNRLIEEIKYDPGLALKYNSMNYGFRGDIKNFVTTIKYNSIGQIDEKYTYYRDTCSNLDDHFLFKIYYLQNGLIDYFDAFDNDKVAFVVRYEYEYYK
jgi:hypothetical protein